MTNARSEVVVATTTMYRSAMETRAQLALVTLEKLSALGYRVVVVDGGSPEEWLEQVWRIDGVTILEESPDPRTGKPSMGAGRRQAMLYASQRIGCKAVAWMEPEKLSFADLLAQAATPVLQGQADLVVPRRTSLASYPIEQQHAEIMGNSAVAGLLGAEFDFWFGPRVWSLKALPHMLNYNGEFGDKWDSLMVPVIFTMADGLRVMSVDVDYIHPAAQTAEEQGSPEMTLKRAEQLYTIIQALIAIVDRLHARGLYEGLGG
ncbi:MAG TPA: hypothetical protein VLA77_03595 [Candidatus Saccharimonadales bacterium]|nr:hypothetical protein [Candidatus Saccharimonadales bacterium]